MKCRFISLLLLSAIACGAATAAGNSGKVKVNKFRLTGPYAVRQPVMIDSTDIGRNKYEATQMLTVSPLGDKDAKPWQGEILPVVKGAASVGELHFCITPKSYTVGKVSVKGPKNFKLFVDGEEKSGELKLIPTPHLIAVKYLCEADKADSIDVEFEYSKGIGVEVGDGSQRRYMLSDNMNGLKLTGARVSPNGKYALVYYRQTEPGGKVISYTDLMETATRRMVSRFQSSQAPRWMPVSNEIVYYQTVGDNTQLYRQNPETGVSRLWISKLPKGGFDIAPTEDYLIMTVSENPDERRPDVYQIIEPDDRQPGWREHSYLARYDIASGVCSRITFGNKSMGLYDISPDGKRLLIGYGKRRLTKQPFYLSTVLELDLATMKCDTIIDREGFMREISYSPDGKEFLIVGSAEFMDGIGSVLGKGVPANDYDYQMFIMDRATKKVRPMTKYFNPSVDSGIMWSKYDGMVYFKGENQDKMTFYRLNPKSGMINEIVTPETFLYGFSIADTAPVALHWGQTDITATNLYMLNTKNTKSQMFIDRSSEITKGITLSPSHEWSFVTSRGDTITGQYTLPLNMEEGRKYPLVVYYYGGCSPVGTYLESYYSPQMFAAQDYIFLVLEPSGATGFGQEFAARHVNAWGDYSAADIIEGTKKFCAEHSFADAAKIGCMGASYGGFMTQYLQTQTDIFAAAVSHAGISNITSYWGGGYWGYSYSQVASRYRYPWTNPEMYTKHSPLFNADKVKTPLLFVHGDADTNVPFNESVQMFTALKLLGKETAFVAVNNQDHHILDYQKRITWQNTIFAWFAKWLKGDSEWWNAMYPEKDY